MILEHLDVLVGRLSGFHLPETSGAMICFLGPALLVHVFSITAHFGLNLPWILCDHA